MSQATTADDDPKLFGGKDAEKWGPERRAPPSIFGGCTQNMEDSE
jgi:hypothetical protein